MRNQRRLGGIKKEISPLKALKLSQLRPVVKVRKRRTLEQKTAQQLVKEADKWFSKYVRLRDSYFNGSEWVSTCICCDNKPLLVIDADGKWKLGVDNGHFISRGKYLLRYNEFNTNAQSSYCNAWADKETMLEGYRKGIINKYGVEVLKELKELSKSPDAYKRPGKAELLQIIVYSKAYVAHALAHPENYGTN